MISIGCSRAEVIASGLTLMQESRMTEVPLCLVNMPCTEKDFLTELAGKGAAARLHTTYPMLSFLPGSCWPE